LAIDLECQIKGSARGYDPEITVEHDERFGDRIHDGLRQNTYVLNAQEGLNVGHMWLLDLTRRKGNPR
jgi:hypothetical protein